MSPSPEFYDKIEHGEFNSQVGKWEEAKFDEDFYQGTSYLCKLKTPAGKTFFAYMRIGDNLGMGSIRIPLAVSESVQFDENRIGFKWMTEINQSQVSSSSRSESVESIYRELGLTSGRQQGDIKRDFYNRGPFTDGFTLSFDREGRALVTGWRSLKREGVTRAGSAFGMATHFANTFPGWKIQPINASLHLWSPEPILVHELLGGCLKFSVGLPRVAK